MLITNEFEFRGLTSTPKSNGGVNNYVSVEDSTGESCKFYCLETAGDLNKLQKGKRYKFTLDYNSKYGSLKIAKFENC